MNRFIKKLITGSCAAAFLLSNCLTAFAEISLPDGTVAGLPEKLSVLDSEGNSVSESGEYFFCVENMQPKESYSKDIQITNLREDKAYHIYFYAEPIAKSGEIDLEENCTAVFALDERQVFSGKVTGQADDGSINLADEPIDLGLFVPGQSRSLNCTVTWNGEGLDGFVDYGHKLVTSDGVEIIRQPSGSAYVDGEVTFRWVFYAVVDDSYQPPETGVLSAQSVAYAAAVAACLAAIAVMLMLVIIKKRKKCKE